MANYHFFKLSDHNSGTLVISLGYWDSRTNNLRQNSNKDVGWVTTEFPEFLVEVTFLCSSRTVADRLAAFGCPLSIVPSEHDGETWYLNNGSYYTFDNSGVTLYLADGTNVLRQQVSGDIVTSFYGFPSNNGSIIASQGYFREGDLTVNTDNTISFYRTCLTGGLNAETTAKMDLFYTGVTPELEDTDPYNPGGSSEPGGGTGDFDGTGDDIDFPSLPTLSAVDTGFITLFNPSAGELRSLANYMWSNPLFDLDAWKKIFADPMDAILGLSIVPVAVPNGGAASVTVGNISTGVSMNKAAAQYVEIDCGTLNVNEFWGAYLDYDPFTKAELYLPYIGTHPIAVDDIMNKPVHIKYHIDILSGACCAYVKCGGSVLYSFVGQCSCSIPITGNDWTNVVNGALTIAASIGTMVATGGASAPMAVSAIASTAVNSMKPNVEKSGSMGGMGGMLGVQTPYLILTRPRQALPAYQNRFSGYPSFITRQLSDISGYTEIESIHLDGIPATEQELSEIESLLKGGVIL